MEKKPIEKLKKLLPKEPLINYEVKEVLSLTDIYSILLLLLYTVLAIFYYPYLPNPNLIIWLNIFAIGAIVTFAIIDEKLKAGRFFMLFRRISLVPLVFLLYSQVHYYIRLINPHDYDLLLISWDYAIFGLNPTQFLYQFANPVLTEFLMISYMLYFFMPLTQGVELHLRHKDAEFREFSRVIILAFYFSYLLYFILPAIGPRFYLHDFKNLNMEMPGIFLTNLFREAVNAGGGIPAGSLNPADVVNKDCMPSGHTLITLLNMYLGFKFKSIFRWFFLIFGSSLVFATVFLRYHYVVDIIAGILLAVVVLLINPLIRNHVKKWGFIKV